MQVRTEAGRRAREIVRVGWKENRPLIILLNHGHHPKRLQPFLWRWRLTCQELDLGALPSKIEEDARGIVRLFEFRAIVA
jgi:hypothetical protein